MSVAIALCALVNYGRMAVSWDLNDDGLTKAVAVGLIDGNEKHQYILWNPSWDFALWESKPNDTKNEKKSFWVLNKVLSLNQAQYTMFVMGLKDNSKRVID